MGSVHHRAAKLSIGDTEKNDEKPNIYCTRAFVFHQVRVRGLNIHPRGGHRIACDEDGNIYCFGGLNLSAADSDGIHREPIPVFRKLWQFNHLRCRWRRINIDDKQLKCSLSSTLIYNRHHLFIYGGTNYPFGDKCDRRIHMINLRNLNQTKIQPNEDEYGRKNLPPKMYGQGVCADTERCHFYTMGGTSGLVYNACLHRFDFIKHQWEYIKPVDGEPDNRYRHGLYFKDDKLYVVGGCRETECIKFDTMPVFYLDKRRWVHHETKPDPVYSYPSARQFQSSVLFRGEVYMIGGRRRDTICTDFWKINLDTFQWTLLNASVPLPTYFGSATVDSSGLMTMFSGVYDLKNDYRCNTITTVRLAVCPLREIAWLSYLESHDIDKLIESGEDELLRIGIPQDLVRKLLVNALYE